MSLTTINSSLLRTLFGIYIFIAILSFAQAVSFVPRGYFTDKTVEPTYTKDQKDDVLINL
ncbi:hypothetical protein PHYBLDRAFT_158404 [Phycomyces blakesleeanus NRRL 1555(-)]|uniref:Uncharacterized protein n=1 Tax=Phycomyces blakesleeanus (strain ATCC 8743b / DSM 1359 / FGSC 10004 / NBRC 33097 / NRRL 1555) TaxID=763407 RepID=A0A167N9X9_PHYB8|nr:hypothetical protein PHYBLDRAFT_158404 [Phycomyces blakesleeanus NRRL 1555(-)]OAD75440.1 hypothetical protein PHYBLDRAFT_158404 [Phycomyces blakesleeanus NRRL 1555(-)]|eukprot:XP_018293480.1 hypothetical protein PHYBLDRAFT_158404 [Phycomyces blakesleeanus NRRL 1555(-)]